MSTEDSGNSEHVASSPDFLYFHVSLYPLPLKKILYLVPVGFFLLALLLLHDDAQQKSWPLKCGPCALRPLTPLTYFHSLLRTLYSTFSGLFSKEYSVLSHCCVEVCIIPLVWKAFIPWCPLLSLFEQDFNTVSWEIFNQWSPQVPRQNWGIGQ